MADPSGLQMSFARFSATVPAGNPDHVWMGPLKAMHGREQHTRPEWVSLIATLKARPVSYDNLRRVVGVGKRK